ncbi:rab-GTPase-TBC domain-containing protein [Baffinella frigidus]|nr:rab-GTPase-TBC domain-containing protein [Cryptophyta sp. CCMP2293]
MPQIEPTTRNHTGQLLEPLRRVLSAYCIRDRRVGYCQAMNFVAATLLLVLEEDDAFWVLCCVLEDIVPGYLLNPTT